MHFQVVNPLILTLKIEVQTKKYANSLGISLRQSTITRQASRQETSATRQIRIKILLVLVLVLDLGSPHPVEHTLRVNP
jgi:hypothetical protein